MLCPPGPLSHLWSQGLLLRQALVPGDPAGTVLLYPYMPDQEVCAKSVEPAGSLRDIRLSGSSLFCLLLMILFDPQLPPLQK